MQSRKAKIKTREVMKYNRILLKLSGESLAGESGRGLSTEVLDSYAQQIKKATERGVQIGIVIGGGNIFRGCRAWVVALTA